MVKQDSKGRRFVQAVKRNKVGSGSGGAQTTGTENPNPAAFDLDNALSESQINALHAEMGGKRKYRKGRKGNKQLGNLRGKDFIVGTLVDPDLKTRLHKSTPKRSLTQIKHDVKATLMNKMMAGIGKKQLLNKKAKNGSVLGRKVYSNLNVAREMFKGDKSVKSKHIIDTFNEAIKAASLNNYSAITMVNEKTVDKKGKSAERISGWNKIQRKFLKGKKPGTEAWHTANDAAVAAYEKQKLIL